MTLASFLSQKMATKLEAHMLGLLRKKAHKLVAHKLETDCAYLCLEPSTGLGRFRRNIENIRWRNFPFWEVLYLINKCNYYFKIPFS